MATKGWGGWEGEEEIKVEDSPRIPALHVARKYIHVHLPTILAFYIYLPVTFAAYFILADLCLIQRNTVAP